MIVEAKIDFQFRILLPNYNLADGSKQKFGVGAGVYFEETSSKMCLKLPVKCNELQAVITVIMNEQMA